MMNSDSKIFDSPIDWVRSHIQEYVNTDGQKGHNWRGFPTLLLITKGRNSGKLRRTALIYGQDSNHYIVVASNGGATHHPQWYLNLETNPVVNVQVGAEKFKAQARTANIKQKPRLWHLMAKIFPQYDEYQIKATEAGRDIPVVILSPLEPQN